MKIGDLVIERKTGKRLTVKATGGSDQVLCGWMETNSRGEQVECSSAFNWESLRNPTPEETANVPAEPEREKQTVTADDVGEVPADIAEPAHKRKGK